MWVWLVVSWSHVNGIPISASKRGKSRPLIFLMCTTRQQATLKLGIQGHQVALWFLASARERLSGASVSMMHIHCPPLSLKYFKSLRVGEY